MGISGLLRALKTVMERKHLQDLSGQSAAVDALGWLHRGTYCCSTEICVNADWSKCISYCMKRVEMLRHFGVKPIMVFDGDNLPMKKDTENARQQSRKEALARGYKLYQEGRGAEAQQEFIKAVDVTPAMIRSLIDRLEASGVDFVVAPYEADAQLAYLQRQGKADFVISEDSDCIAFGCDRVLFKLDNEGSGDYFDRKALGTNKQLAMKTFTHDMVLDMCILAGCDYLDSLPGMGIVRAHKLVHQYRKTERILRGLRFNGKTSVPKNYEARFIRARLTFCHQLVHPYTPGVKNGLVPLNAVDADAVAKLLPLEDRILHFAGPQIDDTVAHHIARGKINAITKIPFADEPAPRPLIKAIESATLAMPSKVSAPGPMDRFLSR
ncbi:Flap endonuclease 1 [Hondaea fermentalgiana]|uniref:Flap endonuclease 1 n=1 Tax=Hondaea fermentalgiana TaxID=2315210 RepID=A0A2R5GR55_9STRA|nr:Flap endonuclease 1 [Hondaea fermentalgiana]|eukprot:GBG33330.1 Flap endonuclease 1 [Hondaea fermentalgiana]